MLLDQYDRNIVCALFAENRTWRRQLSKQNYNHISLADRVILNQKRGKLGEVQDVEYRVSIRLIITDPEAFRILQIEDIIIVSWAWQTPGTSHFKQLSSERMLPVKCKQSQIVANALFCLEDWIDAFFERILYIIDSNFKCGNKSRC